MNIAIHSDYQKSGLSQRLLSEFKKLANKKVVEKIVPIRPSFKWIIHLHLLITTSIGNERIIFDPWIRTHWKLGAKIVRPIYKAFTVTGTIKDCEEWTSMHFRESGRYVIQGALQPIQIDRENDFGIYYDPNLWMENQLTG
jgi:hypothetical protein